MLTDRIHRRFESVRARIAERHQVVGVAFVAVVCDGCGCTLAEATPELLTAAAWQERWRIGEKPGDRDFCGACS